MFNVGDKVYEFNSKIWNEYIVTKVGKKYVYIKESDVRYQEIKCNIGNDCLIEVTNYTSRVFYIQKRCDLIDKATHIKATLKKLCEIPLYDNSAYLEEDILKIKQQLIDLANRL